MVLITIFFVVLLGISFLFLNKAKEMSSGKPYVNLVFGSDFHLRRKIETAKVSVKVLPKKAAKATAYFAVKHGVKVYEKARAYVYPKIAHIVDAVKGKHIPESKGSASAFLRKIEEHKAKE